MVKVNITSKREQSAQAATENQNHDLKKVSRHSFESSISFERNKSNQSFLKSIDQESNSATTPTGRTFLDALGEYRFRKVFSIEDDRETEIIEWSSPNNPFQKRRKQSFNWKKTWLQILFSTIGALVLGSIMGISVLSLFFAEDSKNHSKNTIDSHLATLPRTNPEAPRQGGAPVAVENPNGFPILPVILMETGSYGDSSAAQKGVFDLRAKGFASVLSFTHPDRIFVGITLDDKQAGLLATSLKQKGIPVVQRKIMLSKQGSQKQIDPSLQSFIQLGNQIVQDMTPTTVSQLTSSNEPSPFPFDASYLEKHRKFVTESQVIATTLPQTAKNYLSEMVRGIDQAVQAAEEAHKNPNTALLGMIQEGLIRYSTSYQQLIESL